jgi:hypothetical protein
VPNPGNPVVWSVVSIARGAASSSTVRAGQWCRPRSPERISLGALQPLPQVGGLLHEVGTLAFEHADPILETLDRLLRGDQVATKRGDLRSGGGEQILELAFASQRCGDGVVTVGCLGDCRGLVVASLAGSVGADAVGVAGPLAGSAALARHGHREHCNET